jgi:hypothetical protein
MTKRELYEEKWKRYGGKTKHREKIYEKKSTARSGVAAGPVAPATHFTDNASACEGQLCPTLIEDDNNATHTRTNRATHQKQHAQPDINGQARSTHVRHLTTGKERCRITT